MVIESATLQRAATRTVVHGVARDSLYSAQTEPRPTRKRTGREIRCCYNRTLLAPRLHIA